MFLFCGTVTRKRHCTGIKTTMVNLRMKTPPGSAQKFTTTPDVAGLHDRLRVMRRQEGSSYRCENYIGRRSREICHRVGSHCDKEEIDVVCRKVMCEWSYRIVDHFRGDREIVAIAFSCLDRFVDRCSCDRTAFKLAAITCLYVSIKAFGRKHISIKSLAKLSRGEFDSDHIAEMERIIFRPSSGGSTRPLQGPSSRNI